MKGKAAILAVDDNSEALTLLVKILGSAGYQVFPADSGELALASVEVHHPDLILLDVRMKGIDGLEVCRQLKADKKTRHIPIILISAFAEVKDWVEGLRLGASDYITKPFQIEELLIRVQTHIALARANISLAQHATELQETNNRLKAELAERKRAEESLASKARSLEDARSKIKILSGMIPICSYCKKIRDDQGFWQRVEDYISQHSEAEFSHGLCNDCMKIHFPEYAQSCEENKV